MSNINNNFHLFKSQPDAMGHGAVVGVTVTAVALSILTIVLIKCHMLNKYLSPSSRKIVWITSLSTGSAAALITLNGLCVRASKQGASTGQPTRKNPALTDPLPQELPPLSNTVTSRQVDMLPAHAVDVNKSCFSHIPERNAPKPFNYEPISNVLKYNSRNFRHNLATLIALMVPGESRFNDNRTMTDELPAITFKKGRCTMCLHFRSQESGKQMHRALLKMQIAGEYIEEEYVCYHGNFPCMVTLRGGDVAQLIQGVFRISNESYHAFLNWVSRSHLPRRGTTRLRPAEISAQDMEAFKEQAIPMLSTPLDDENADTFFVPPRLKGLSVVESIGATFSLIAPGINTYNDAKEKKHLCQLEWSKEFLTIHYEREQDARKAYTALNKTFDSDLYRPLGTRTNPSKPYTLLKLSKPVDIANLLRQVCHLSPMEIFDLEGESELLTQVKVEAKRLIPDERAEDYGETTYFDHTTDWNPAPFTFNHSCMGAMPKAPPLPTEAENEPIATLKTLFTRHHSNIPAGLLRDENASEAWSQEKAEKSLQQLLDVSDGTIDSYVGLPPTDEEQALFREGQINMLRHVIHMMRQIENDVSDAFQKLRPIIFHLRHINDEILNEQIAELAHIKDLKKESVHSITQSLQRVTHLKNKLAPIIDGLQQIEKAQEGYDKLPCILANLACAGSHCAARHSQELILAFQSLLPHQTDDRYTKLGDPKLRALIARLPIADQKALKELNMQWFLFRNNAFDAMVYTIYEELKRANQNLDLTHVRLSCMKKIGQLRGITGSGSFDLEDVFANLGAQYSTARLLKLFDTKYCSLGHFIAHLTKRYNGMHPLQNNADDVASCYLYHIPKDKSHLVAFYDTTSTTDDRIDLNLTALLQVLDHLRIIKRT